MVSSGALCSNWGQIKFAVCVLCEPYGERKAKLYASARRKKKFGCRCKITSDLGKQKDTSHWGVSLGRHLAGRSVKKLRYMRRNHVYLRPLNLRPKQLRTRYGATHWNWALRALCDTLLFSKISVYSDPSSSLTTLISSANPCESPEFHTVLCVRPGIYILVAHGRRTPPSSSCAPCRRVGPWCATSLSSRHARLTPPPLYITPAGLPCTLPTRRSVGARGLNRLWCAG